MRNFIKEEKAEFAIDAIFGITFFMISLIAIMFMALIIRVQSNIQYALGQTVKEISGYYYLVDKLGLAGATAGASSEPIEVDKTVSTIVDFSTKTTDGFESVGSTIDDLPEDIKNMDFDAIKGNVDELQKSFEASYESFGTMKTSIQSTLSSENVMDNAKQVLTVFAKTAVNGVVSNLVAPMVCEALMPRYLTADYEAMGISDVTFTGSQFLVDRRSIKVVITYKLDLEKYTLGFVTSSITFHQIASTAAWVRPDGKNLVSITELNYK
ncbi:MAG: hypothetical protein K2G25_04845 [Oscillospiraceae bacterium]|nr:hypothetical protein [Oscillospiraceae bacterium]